MPTKHIDKATWRLIEKAAVKATIATLKPVSEAEMLGWLVRKGLEDLNEIDFKRWIAERESR